MPWMHKGKMHSKSFPPSTYCAEEPFDLIHSDFKSFPVDSYHKFRYYIPFYNDASSAVCVMVLRHVHMQNERRTSRAGLNTDMDNKLSN